MIADESHLIIIVLLKVDGMDLEGKKGKERQSLKN